MNAPEDIETLADLATALDKVTYAKSLPDTAPLAVILAHAAGEENRPEWALYSEVHHLLDASLMRCCLDPDQGDDELPEHVRQRLEAAWRTADLVARKVRALEALHAMRMREVNAELERLRQDAAAPVVQTPAPNAG